MHFREQYTKQFKKIIKKANKMFEKDVGFKGKYFIRIIKTKMWTFPDNSGGELTALIRCYNKESGIMQDCRIEYAPWMDSFYWQLNMRILNEFIVKVCKDRADINCKDWTKVKVPDEVFTDTELYLGGHRGVKAYEGINKAAID